MLGHACQFTETKKEENMHLNVVVGTMDGFVGSLEGRASLDRLKMGFDDSARRGLRQLARPAAALLARPLSGGLLRGKGGL